jgi:predicted transcriptional regulator
MRGFIDRLNHKREALGISHARLAEMTGVSLLTVQRFFAQGNDNISFATICKMADALGIDLMAQEKTSAQEMLEARARAKAREMAKIVQGTSALEAQGVNTVTLNEIENGIFYTLMNGSKRTLWNG